MLKRIYITESDSKLMPMVKEIGIVVRFDHVSKLGIRELGIKEYNFCLLFYHPYSILYTSFVIFGATLI